MPVYFRKAKPFPRMGGGGLLEKGKKRMSRKEEMKADETDVWIADCEMLQCCRHLESVAREPG